MPKKNSKKEEKKADVVKEDFNIDEALQNNAINPFILDGFMAFIKDIDVTSQRQFDELYNQFIGGKTN